MSKVILLKPKQLKELIEEYRTTVNALLCFVSLTTWDGKTKPDSKYSFGRRMTTSDSNRVSPSTDVTPDLVVQVTLTEGYICEAKISICKDQNNWRDTVDQLRKYDDQLIGWWTDNEQLNDSNTVLLFKMTHIRQFIKFTEDLQKAEGILYNKPVAYVGFIVQSGTEETIFMRTEWGKVNNTTLQSSLENGKVIQLEKVIGTYGSKKFYDHNPEPEYLMEVMWSHLFTAWKSNGMYDEQKRVWLIPVEIQKVTDELQKLYGNYSKEPRERSYPKISWVREALEYLSLINLAEKKDQEHYTILFKDIRKDLIEKFSLARKKMKAKKEKEKQIALALQTKI